MPLNLISKSFKTSQELKINSRKATILLDFHPHNQLKCFEVLDIG